MIKSLNSLKPLLIFFLLISPKNVIGQYVDDIYFNDDEMDYSYINDSNSLNNS